MMLYSEDKTEDLSPGHSLSDGSEDGSEEVRWGSQDL